MFTVTRTAVCVVAVMIVTGCSSTGSGTTPGSSPTRPSTSTGSPEGNAGTPQGRTEGNGTIMKDAFDALMRRPSLATVETDYQSMYERIRTRLETEIGIPSWSPDARPTSGTACGGGLSGLHDAQERLYNAGSSSGNLPDAQWDQAVAIVSEVATQHGFGAPEVVVSGPGDHEVELKDHYSGYLTFGTGANTVLFGGTGCHLTEVAHQRGTYLPPQY